MPSARTRVNSHLRPYETSPSPAIRDITVSGHTRHLRLRPHMTSPPPAKTPPSPAETCICNRVAVGWGGGTFGSHSSHTSGEAAKRKHLFPSLSRGGRASPDNTTPSNSPHSSSKSIAETFCLPTSYHRMSLMLASLLTVIIPISLNSS
jgi:hypothetical protein